MKFTNMGRKHTRKNGKNKCNQNIYTEKNIVKEVKEEDIPYIYMVDNHRKHQEMFDKIIEEEEKQRQENEYPNFWL